MCRAPKHEQGKDMSQDMSELSQEREALTPGASQPEQEEKGFFRGQVIKGSKLEPNRSESSIHTCGAEQTMGIMRPPAKGRSPVMAENDPVFLFSCCYLQYQG